LKLTTDRHKGSRRLSATAELLVVCTRSKSGHVGGHRPTSVTFENSTRLLVVTGGVE